jgi:FkbM family methyltransferase
MKVEKLISKNQPQNWFDQITKECIDEYPIHLVDIDASERVVDMGCNVGGFSQAFNYRFHNILAIDASSYNVEQYKSRHNNEIIHKAVYSKDGEIVKLKKYMGNGDDDTNSGNFSITGFVYENNKHGFRGDEYEEVETISLETILDMVGGNIGLLKIDIEGAEVDVLFEKDLSKINYITGEFHNFLGNENQTKLFDWIGKTHSEIYSVGNGVDSHFIKMWKRK